MTSTRHPDETFLHARVAAAQGDFATMQQLGLQLHQDWANDANRLLQLGKLWQQSGFLAHAQHCFDRAHALAPADVAPLAGLARVATDRAQHALASALYQQLLQAAPHNLAIRRNALLSMEYDLDATPAARKKAAVDWAHQAKAQATSQASSTPAPHQRGGRLRVGYVSADFCQHTVGLLVKDVLAQHNREQFDIFAYSAGQVKDWVTEQIRKTCVWRDVSRMSDTELVQQIRNDQIDVLVDLSGHTAGSRLSVFIHRPAPVQLSWLGYFATTGLDAMDAVLLDEWHAPPGTEAQFVEKIVRLPCGRLPYQPVPWAPEPSPPPSLRKGYITFGSFNNTSKLNPQVLQVWAEVLKAVPDSRLLLKWRTFNDAEYRETLTQQFAQAGIDPERLELRGPSFHNQVLDEYADMDIALDPFPFTGGQTSCEALWMGVPVITWPQERVISRQTLALLAVMNRGEWIAHSTRDYVDRASQLANNPTQLVQARTSLRQEMQKCAFTQPKVIAQALEQAYVQGLINAP